LAHQIELVDLVCRRHGVCVVTPRGRAAGRSIGPAWCRRTSAGATARSPANTRGLVEWNTSVRSPSAVSSRTPPTPRRSPAPAGPRPAAVQPLGDSSDPPRARARADTGSPRRSESTRQGAAGIFLPRNRDVDPSIDSTQHVARGLRVLVLDRTADTDHLPRIALVPHQADADELASADRQRLHMIAGEIPRPPRRDSRTQDQVRYSMQKVRETGGHKAIG